jgi:osmotically-inducible protein OsmY
VLAAACASGPRNSPTANPRAWDDAVVVTKVKTALLNDAQLGLMKIDVDAVDGVVTLSGTVPATADAEKAMGLTRRVEGVKDVKSGLQVLTQR